MNEERIPKKGLNMKGKGKCQRGNLKSEGMNSEEERSGWELGQERCGTEEGNKNDGRKRRRTEVAEILDPLKMVK